MSEKNVPYQPGNFMRVPNPREVLKLKGCDLSTYLTLCARADAYGRCWPSVAAIVEQTEYSERQVRKSLTTITKKGLVRKVNRRRNDGSQSSNEYQLLLQVQGAVYDRGGGAVDCTPYNYNHNELSPSDRGADAPADASNIGETSPDDLVAPSLPPAETPPVPPGSRAADPLPTVKKLYYDVVKKYQLPVFNHAVLQKKIKDLENEVGTDPAVIYLSALLQFDWNALEGEFKPLIANSYDIYAKRVQILAFLKQHRGEQKKYWNEEDDRPQRGLGEA